MIQLASLSASTPETPAKTGVPASVDGGFSKFLKGLQGKTGNRPGEELPGGGKDLPVQLPLDIAAAKAAHAGKGKHAAIEGDPLDDKLDLAEPRKEASPETADGTDGISMKSLGAVIAMIAASAGQQPNSGEGKATSDQQESGQSGVDIYPPAAANRRAEHRIDLASNATHPTAPATGELPEMAQVQRDQRKGQRGEEPPMKTAAREAAIDPASKSKLPEATELAGLRANSGNAAAHAHGQSIPVAQIADAAGADLAGKAGAQSINQSQAVRPHDFASLVDRLVEARDSGRAASGHLSVMHSDFGAVTMRFSHDGANLHVSLANADPEFARSVSAALPADTSGNGDALLQNGQKEGGLQQFFARADAGNHGAGTHGSGDHGEMPGDRTFGDTQTEFADEPIRSEGQHGWSRNGGGIFA